MKKSIILFFVLISIFLYGCQTTGQAYTTYRAQGVDPAQTEKVCCGVQDRFGQWIYTYAENEYICYDLQGTLLPCPRTCCNVNGYLYGEYSYNTCLSRGGTLSKCPAMG